MTFSVIVHPTAGQFEAALVGAPEVSATAATRALEVRRGLAGLFGKFRDDPTLREICEEAYKERDADIRE